MAYLESSPYFNHLKENGIITHHNKRHKTQHISNISVYKKQASVEKKLEKIKRESVNTHRKQNASLHTLSSS